MAGHKEQGIAALRSRGARPCGLPSAGYVRRPIYGARAFLPLILLLSPRLAGHLSRLRRSAFSVRARSTSAIAQPLVEKVEGFAGRQPKRSGGAAPAPYSAKLPLFASTTFGSVNGTGGFLPPALMSIGALPTWLPLTTHLPMRGVVSPA